MQKKSQTSEHIGTIERVDTDFDWADSETLMQTDVGIVKCGTCLKIANNIIFLNSYSSQQLDKLKRMVDEAVDHELHKRNL